MSRVELPSGPAESASLPEAPPCPFCDGSDTELLSAFGSHASVSTYWCRRCRSPFEIFKWRPEPSGPDDGGVGPAIQDEDGEDER